MSSDSNIATVDQTGLVTAVNWGQAIITAYDMNDDNLKASLNVYVSSIEIPTPTPIVAVTGLSIVSENGENTLNVGESLLLQAIVEPDVATNKEVEWSLSTPNIIQFSPGTSGVSDNTITINGLSAGTTIIYATSQENSSIQAQFEVTVN